MSNFWFGYLAGLVTAILPSLVYFTVLIRRAPEMNEDTDASLASGNLPERGLGPKH